MEAITKKGKKVRGRLAEILVRKGTAIEVKEEVKEEVKKPASKKKAAPKNKK